MPIRESRSTPWRVLSSRRWWFRHRGGGLVAAVMVSSRGWWILWFCCICLRRSGFCEWDSSRGFGGLCVLLIVFVDLGFVGENHRWGFVVLLCFRVIWVVVVQIVAMWCSWEMGWWWFVLDAWSWVSDLCLLWVLMLEARLVICGW